MPSDYFRENPNGDHHRLDLVGGVLNVITRAAFGRSNVRSVLNQRILPIDLKDMGNVSRRLTNHLFSPLESEK